MARYLGSLLGEGRSSGPTDCWLWKAGTKNGYGWFKFPDNISLYSSRAAYALHWRQDPGDLVVMHTCDNRLCCNPGHLVLGTVAQNNADKQIKGRAKPADQTGEKNPSARLSEQDIDIIRRRIAAGETNVAIARDYGVTHQMISKIRRGHNWRHVA